MSRLVRSSLLAVSLALVGCREDPAGPRRLTILDCESGSSYSIGRTVDGRLIPGDCFAPGDDALADYYQFTMRSAGPVSISVTTPATSAPMVIAILDANEEILDFDVFPAGAGGILGGELEAGDYILIIAASEAGQVGAYSLSSSNTLPPTFPCDRFIPLAIPSTVNGTIEATDCLDPVGSASADYYDFTLAAPGPVSFLVTPSTTGRMIVGLSTSRGFFLDVLETTRDVPVSIGGMLEAGRFVLIVAGDVAGQTGEYTIVSRATLPPIGGVPPWLGCTTGVPYTIGTPVSGSLSTTDCTNAFATPQDRYDFTLAAGQTVTIDLRSVSFDPFLALFDADGGLIAYDDDGGDGLDSRITVALPAGSYAIGATGYYSSALGDYTLATTTSSAEAVSVMSACVPLSEAVAAGFSLQQMASTCGRDGQVWRASRVEGEKAPRGLR